MASLRLCVGALAVAAVAVHASPCRPTITSSLIAGYTTTATFIDPESTFTSTDPFIALSSNTVFTDTTATSIELTDHATTSAEATITTEAAATTAEVIITAAETATTTAAESLVTVQFLGVGSDDPNFAISGGIGFPELASFGGTNSIFNINLGSNPANYQKFTINENTGEVKSFTGPGNAPGESVYYSTDNGVASASELFVAPRSYAESEGKELLVCKIATGRGYEFLQCNFGNQGFADFWTCSGHLNVVEPGYDFTNQCENGATAYKVPLFQVLRT